MWTRREERGSEGPVLRDPLAAKGLLGTPPQPYNNANRFGGDRGRGGRGRFSGNRFNANRNGGQNNFGNALRQFGGHQEETSFQEQNFGRNNNFGNASQQFASHEEEYEREMFPRALEQSQFPQEIPPLMQQQQPPSIWGAHQPLLQQPEKPNPPPLFGVPPPLMQEPHQQMPDLSTLFQQPPSLLNMFQQPFMFQQQQEAQQTYEPPQPPLPPPPLPLLQPPPPPPELMPQSTNNQSSSTANNDADDWYDVVSDYPKANENSNQSSDAPWYAEFAKEFPDAVDKQNKQQTLSWELRGEAQIELEKPPEPEPPWYAEFLPPKPGYVDPDPLGLKPRRPRDDNRMNPYSKPPQQPKQEMVANPLFSKQAQGPSGFNSFNKSATDGNNQNQYRHNTQSQPEMLQRNPRSFFQDKSPKQADSGSGIPSLLSLPTNNPFNSFTDSSTSNPFVNKTPVAYNQNQPFRPNAESNPFQNQKAPSVFTSSTMDKAFDMGASFQNMDSGQNQYGQQPKSLDERLREMAQGGGSSNAGFTQSTGRGGGRGGGGGFGQAPNQNFRGGGPERFNGGRGGMGGNSNAMSFGGNKVGFEGNESGRGRGGGRGGGRGQSGGRRGGYFNNNSMNGQHQNQANKPALLPTPKLVPYPPPPPAQPVQRNPRGILKPASKYSNFVEGGFVNKEYDTPKPKDNPVGVVPYSYEEDEVDEDDVEYLGDMACSGSASQNENSHDFFSEKMVQHFAMLLKDKSLEEQLEGLLTHVLLVPEFLATRVEIVRNLHITMRERYKNCVLHPYGADFIGIGNSDDSVNVFVDLTGKQGPSATCNSSSPEGSDFTKQTVDDLLQHIQTGKHHSFFGQIVKRTNFGRINLPVISFIHSDTKVRCNIRLENYFLVQEAKMIQFLSSLDQRITPLLAIIRYWSSVHKVLDTPEEDTRNRFISLLVLFVLARKKIIPTMAHLHSQCKKPIYFEYINIGFCDDNSIIPANENSALEDKNIFTLSTLCILKEFFKVFATANLKEEVVSLWRAEFIPKENFSPDVEAKLLDPELRKRYRFGANGRLLGRRLDCSSRLCIQDFQDLTENLSVAVPEYDVSKFQIECEVAVGRLENLMVNGSGSIMDLYIVTDYNTSVD